MTSWPLYAFYIVLLGLPLLFFVVSKPDYEKKTGASPTLLETPKPAFKHSAKHNARSRVLPNESRLGATAPPTEAAAPS